MKLTFLKVIIFYSYVTSAQVISDIGSFGLDAISAVQSIFTSPSLKVQVPFCLGLKSNCLSLKLCNLTLQDGDMNISSPVGFCSQGNTGAAVDFSSPTGLPTITITPPTANGSVPLDPSGMCTCNACEVNCVGNPLSGCPANETDMPLNVTLQLTQFPNATASFCQSFNPSRQCFGLILCNLMATVPGVSFAFPTACLIGQALLSFDPNNGNAPVAIQLSNIQPDLPPLMNGTCTCSACPYLCKNNPNVCPQNLTSTTTMSPCTSTRSTTCSSTTSCCSKRYH